MWGDQKESKGHLINKRVFQFISQSNHGNFPTFTHTLTDFPPSYPWGIPHRLFHREKTRGTEIDRRAKPPGTEDLVEMR